MGNMSYCRFRNTAGDLLDCYENFDDYVSLEEAGARKRVYAICQKIIDNFDIEDLEDNLEGGITNG